MKKLIFILIIIMSMNILKAKEYEIYKRIYNNKAKIIIKTKEKTNMIFFYGDSINNMLNSQIKLDYKNKHIIYLENLKENKVYYYKFQMQTENKRKIVSKIMKFKTKGIKKPEIVILNTAIFENFVIIYFETNKKTFCEIEIKSDDYYKRIKNRLAKKYYKLMVKNLLPETEYILKIKGKDLQKNIFNLTKKIITKQFNVALNKPIIVSTFDKHLPDVEGNSSTNWIAKANDGDFTYANGLTQSASILKQNQVLVIDLEKEYVLERIEVYFRALAYPKKYFLYVSTDNKEWKLIAKQNAEYGNNMRSTTGDPMKQNIINTNALARYIKLFIPQKADFFVKHKEWDFVQLFEIKVIADKYKNKIENYPEKVYNRLMKNYYWRN